jgi:hypothetical protein
VFAACVRDDRHHRGRVFDAIVRALRAILGGLVILVAGAALNASGAGRGPYAVVPILLLLDFLGLTELR